MPARPQRVEPLSIVDNSTAIRSAACLQLGVTVRAKISKILGPVVELIAVLVIKNQRELLPAPEQRLLMED
jgi:hypothetical protein